MKSHFLLWKVNSNSDMEKFLPLNRPRLMTMTMNSLSGGQRNTYVVLFMHPIIQGKYNPILVTNDNPTPEDKNFLKFNKDDILNRGSAASSKRVSQALSTPNGSSLLSVPQPQRQGRRSRRNSGAMETEIIVNPVTEIKITTVDDDLQIIEPAEIVRASLSSRTSLGNGGLAMTEDDGVGYDSSVNAMMGNDNNNNNHANHLSPNINGSFMAGESAEEDAVLEMVQEERCGLLFFKVTEENSDITF
jgi:hypothetical protein